MSFDYTTWNGLAVFVEVFWKSSVALGAALCLTGLLRSKSADLRRLVLSTAIIAMLAAAVVLPVLPRWTAVTPSWLRLQSDAVPPAFEPIPIGGMQEVPAWESRTPNPRPPIRVPGPIPLIWLVGTALLLIRFVARLRALRRLRNASDPVADPDLPAYLAERSRRVVLLQNQTIAAPATWGIVRPVILVPAGFEQLPAESRNAVLCHEFAHIEAQDFLLRVLSEVARALLWFQPLIWIVRRQLREVQELACDDRVLAEGARPSTYAKLLMDWDGHLRNNDLSIAAGIAQGSCLKRRLCALLDHDRPRDAVSRAGVVATWLLGLATALPLAAVSFIPQGAAVPGYLQPLPQRAPVWIAQAAPAPPGNPAPSAPRAQSVPAPPLQFETVSLKLHPRPPNSGHGPVTYPAPHPAAGASYTERVINLQDLVVEAYGVYDYQISGLPEWAAPHLGGMRYDIEAKIPGDGTPTKEQLRQMLQSLLTDRFQLRLHREMRELPVYALVIGKDGSKLREIPEDETPRDHPPKWVAPLYGLVYILGRYADRPVVDETGLRIDAMYETELKEQRVSLRQPDPVAAQAALSAAIEDEMGLKLEPRNERMEVLVIDHVEEPSAD